jgi:hypothetical protein
MGMLSATPAATTDGKMARSASAAACALGLPPAHKYRQHHTTQECGNWRASLSADVCALSLPPGFFLKQWLCPDTTAIKQPVQTFQNSSELWMLIMQVTARKNPKLLWQIAPRMFGELLRQVQPC